VSEVLYVDTSAVLRAVLERGLTPDVEAKLDAAQFLITSRLSLVETGRALTRLRHEGVTESRVADAGREIDAIWARCTVWEITTVVCDLAATVAPTSPLRTLDALHFATYLLAQRRIGGNIELLTADARLAAAVAGGSAQRDPS
jgi:predicted nucleic acid-binding protein